MKAVKYILIVFPWVLVVLMVLYTLYLITKTEVDTSIQQEMRLIKRSEFDLCSRLASVPADNLKSSFPFEEYLNSVNWLSVPDINRDLKIMDSLYPCNNNVIQELMSAVYTTELEKKLSKSFDYFNPDTITMFIRFAEKMKSCSELDTAFGLFYSVVSSHWLGLIANRYGEYYESEPSLKFNYNYRYLADRLRENGFSPSVGTSNAEKIVNYTIELKWSYLFHRFWNSTGLTFKVLTGLGILIIVFPWIFFPLYCAARSRRWKKRESCE